MRSVGKFLIWIGIVILILAGALAAFLFSMSAVDTSSAEMFGWAIILSMFFGIPAAIIAAILILVGAVLVTSAPKRTTYTTPPPPVPPLATPNATANKSRYVQTLAARAAKAAPVSSPEDTLRAALRGNDPSSDPRLRLAIIGLRFIAVALFLWFLFPEAYWNVKFALLMPNTSIGSLALVIVPQIIGAAILPLILWLISNLIKIKFPASRMGMA